MLILKPLGLNDKILEIMTWAKKLKSKERKKEDKRWKGVGGEECKPIEETLRHQL